MPRFVVPFLAILTALALVPIALVVHARVSKSKKPRMHVVFDMDQGESYKPQQKNPFFAGSGSKDGQAMRLPVPGTVARGELREDEHLYLGKVDGEFVTTFPGAVVVNRAFLERGRQRFEVFCATCHGFDGSGKGPTAVRAEEPNVLEQGVWVPLPSYHEERVRERPLGHLYRTIANGYPHEGELNMRPYGPQVGTVDRWAIVAYVRALIRSRMAKPKEVPPEFREKIR